MHAGPLLVRPQAIIYSTIIAMAALAVYDDDSPDVMDLADAGYMSIVVLGPLLALAIAHFFADLADTQISLSRSPSAHDVRTLMGHSLQYLYVAVPAIIIVALAYETGHSVDDGVAFLYLAGIASLFVWGWIVGRRSQSRGWVRIALTLGYGFVGVGIVLVESALQPH